MKDLINHAETGNLHHFYIIEGDKNSLNQELENFFNNNLNSKPFFEKSFDNFLIEDSREIVNKSQIKNLVGEKMIFNFSLNSITIEAQNSLLKAIEEPTNETYFFIIVPDANIFLPTVLSRAIVLKNQKSKIKNDLVKDILRQTPGERIKTIEKIAKDISDEKIERYVAKEIIEGLIIEFRLESSKNSERLKILMDIRQKLDFSGMPIKMLLERAVLVL